MRIGILTFHYADNFGALLQAYALQKYIQINGHEVVFLDYIPESEKKFYSSNLHDAGSIKEIIKKIVSNLQRKDSVLVFNEFRDKNFKIESYEEGIRNLEILIVGSDQVWNENIVKKLEPYLFSECKSPARKISYAASIGNFTISETSKKAFINYLPSFSGISVREKSSEKTLKALGLPCRMVVDPVFLLNKKMWLEFSKCPIGTKCNERFVLVYLLRLDANIIAKANSFAKEHKLKLYFIHPMGKRMKSLLGKRVKYVGPEEFVWLISNAKVVFTNSFHAVSFCCILEKQFYHVQREDLGNRVSSLLSIVKTENTKYGTTVVKIDNIFNKMIAESKRYLIGHIK